MDWRSSGATATVNGAFCGFQAKTGNRYRVCFRWDGKDAWDLEIVDCNY